MSVCFQKNGVREGIIFKQVKIRLILFKRHIKISIIYICRIDDYPYCDRIYYFLVMNLMVRERYREIGIMKALGARNSAVLAFYLIQGSILSLIGSTIGSVVFGDYYDNQISFHFYHSEGIKRYND